MADTIEHIAGGVCEIRMTPAEKDCCERACSKYGDPPCWRLPAMTSDWPQGKPVLPCEDCSEARAALQTKGT